MNINDYFQNRIVNEMEIRSLRMTDNLEPLAELIYATDPWVYPAFFGNVMNAKKVVRDLVLSESIFNNKNIIVATINNYIVGFMLLMEKYPKNNSEQIINVFNKNLQELPKDFKKVLVEYFETLDFDFEGIQIISLAVLKDYRHQGIAKSLLTSLHQGYTFSLACVKDNSIGIKLYEDSGFKYRFEYKGYLGIPCIELVKGGK